MAKFKPNKILIIRFSSIGDIVLTTPVIRCIKLQLKAEIHYITKLSYQSVLKANPYIDKLITIQSKVSEVVKQLKKEKYDLIIDLHNNIRSHQIKLQLGTATFAFNKINLAKWLMVKVKVNRLPDMHIVDRYLNTVKPLGVVNDGQGLDYMIPSTDEIDIPNLFSQHNVSLDKGYIAFVIGATYVTKRLPNEQIIEVVKQISDPVILLGGPTDQKNGEAIVKAAPSHIINACGHYNLNQSASIVRQATKVISHDTGLMHVAAAFQKTIISVWGNTIPAFGMYPYYKKDVYNNTIFEQKGLDCRPCSKLGYDACPKGHFRCMRQMDTKALAKTASLG